MSSQGWVQSHLEVGGQCGSSYLSHGRQPPTPALQANCNYDALMCYTRDAPTAASGYLTFNTTGHWAAIDGVPGVGLGQMMIADIVSSSIGSRAASLAILSDLSAVRARGGAGHGAWVHVYGRV